MVQCEVPLFVLVIPVQSSRQFSFLLWTFVFDIIPVLRATFVFDIIPVLKATFVFDIIPVLRALNKI